MPTNGRAGETECAYILGAGFSRALSIPATEVLSGEVLTRQEAYGGVPLYADTEAFRASFRAVDSFIAGAFLRPPGGVHAYPTLEEVFTSIDLAANEGVALSTRHRPSQLRAIRRFLFFRILATLNRDIGNELTAERRAWASRITERQCVVVSTNWDIALEHLLSACGNSASYEPSAYFDEAIIDDKNCYELVGSASNGVAVVKVHGSSNWLECELCRRVIYTRASKAALLDLSWIRPEDFRAAGVYGKIDLKQLRSRSQGNGRCPRCCGSIGPLMASFSFRKHIRSPTLVAVWRQAEIRLAQSRRWHFIGYSLPDADYEFKHLLKRAQLRRQRDDLVVDVTLLRSVDDAGREFDSVVNRYRRFFGNSIAHVNDGGFDPSVD